MISNFRVSARGRVALLGSTALLAMVASPALAQDGAATGDPVSISDIGSPYGVAEPYGASADASVLDPTVGVPEAQAGGRVDEVVTPEPQIVISNPGTPTTARDTTNVTGIGQMVWDQQNGFISLCTGTLINPRTVIFAAHCVNTRPATDYGANSGGVPISFGFAADNLPALQRWFNPTIGGQPNPLFHQSNPALFLYNVNQVRYNPLSLEAAARGFLYGDVATATLDTPAANIPTWALLFSALPGSATGSAAGTGYNVQLAGYGSNGSAATGSVNGSDFRRRLAENVIGALTDLQTFETFLFGSSTSPDANLYFIDFDDPRRGLSGASPFDFNAFRDNARGAGTPLPTEGITAAGDSGGPLILQSTFTRQIVAGVLSGGYTRFFNGQPANGYGTVSFYQPLYLYWDWIAANNPYRYVTAKAGDGLWSDPTHWTTGVDPNYFIIGPDGQLVNGIPGSPGTGKTPDPTIQFGEMCFQSGGRSQCVNLRTGEFRDEVKPIGTADETGTPGNAAGTGDAAVLRTGVQGWIDGVVPDAQADSTLTTQALPAPTIDNGLPGATNFVPNNSDPVRATGAIGRYFDVTLAAAGTTTLNSVVTVDRFSIIGSPARLNITSAGSLTSLIDVTHGAGVVQVDGTLTSRGDYLFMGGGLMGSGRINTPFLTNIAGAIAPGTAGTVGTLTIGGNLVLASASSLIIDVAGNGVSDRLAVVATTFGPQNAPTNGIATIGGTVALGGATGSIIRAYDLYTILTAQGGVIGKFDAVAPISAILVPELIYSPNAVQARINANSYASVINPASRVQQAFAQLLDANRAPGNLLPIFDVLDLQNAATIQATLENLAPRTETLRTALGIVALDNNSRLVRDRLNALQPGDLGGQMAYYGRRVETAALSLAGMDGAMTTMSDVSVEPVMGRARLPETMSGFLAAGYLDGDSLPMPGTLAPFARDQFDGWYLAGGVETEMGDDGVLGFALSYTDLDGETGTGAQSADGRLYAGNIYGKQEFGRLYVDTQLTAALLETATERPGNLPGQPFTLRSDDNALAIATEVGVGAMFGNRIRFGPRVAGRASHIDFSHVRETGGPTNLVINRQDLTSIEGRAGFVLDGVGRVRPHLAATYVHDFEDRAGTFGANFAGANFGSNVLFDLAGQDNDWVEVSGGLSIDVGQIELSVAADTTIERDDVRNQSYRASVRVRF